MAVFVSAGIAAIGAAVGAVATIGAVATLVAETGIALQVVGAVTHNQKISKIGSYMSIAGGVTSLVSAGIGALGSAAVEGAAEGAAGDAVGGAAGSIEGAATDAVAGDIGNIGGLAGSGSADMSSLMGTNGITGSGTGFLSSAPGGLNGLAADGGAIPGYTAPAINAGTDAALNGTSSSINASNAGMQGFKDPGATGNSYTPSSSASSSFNNPDGSVKPPANTSSSAVSGWFNSLDQKTKSQLLQTGGGMVSGLFQGWTEEQKLAFQKEQANLAQQHYATSVANANSQPIIRFGPTPGLPSTGLINSTKS